MTNLEKHGKLIAISLCSMSFVPIASAVAAQETTPGWHGDKYFNDDEQVAKGWQEVQGEQYYFNEEDGSLDADKTQEGTTAALSSKAAEAIEADVKTAVNETVTAEVARYEETTAKEVLENVRLPEETVLQQETEEIKQEELPAQNEQESSEETVQTEEVTEQPSESLEEAANEIPAEQEQEFVQDEEQEFTDQEPAEQESAEDEQWQQEAEQPAEPVYELLQDAEEPEDDAPAQEPEAVVEEAARPSNPYADLNSSIVNAALSLVGSTDGLQCTEVVQMALAGANVSDAMALWPDVYAATYGYYTDEPQPGNLVYYDNGGRGIDHIAIYIGNGNAVHGNFYDENDESHTVIYSVNVPNAGEPQYIQVER